MNLAIRDIRHKLSRFLLTAVGIGLLLMIVMGMAGIYQGLSEDALSFLERTKADLWVVQKGPAARSRRSPAFPGVWRIACHAVTGVAARAGLRLAHDSARIPGQAACASSSRDWPGPGMTGARCRWSPGGR